MRLKGVEWNAFYADPEVWLEDVWHDDVILSINGEELEDDKIDNVNPKATVTIESGVVYYDENGEKSESLESVIRKWRKSQKIKTICAEIPKDQFDSVCEYLKKLGCKIIL